MPDTALWVPENKLDRLPAAYRHGDDGLVEIEPAGGGFYAGAAALRRQPRRTRLDGGDFLRFARCSSTGAESTGSR